MPSAKVQATRTL